MSEAPDANYVKGRLLCANKSVQDLNFKYYNFFFCKHITQLACFDGPLAEVEELGPSGWTKPHTAHTLNYLVWCRGT